MLEKTRHGPKIRRFHGISRDRRWADAASTSISRKRPPSSIPAPMPLRRLTRTALSLLIAYAIVLGGVLAPTLGHGLGQGLGHGFDPSAQLCAYGAVQPAEPSPDGPQPRGMHDCCPALCGGLSAVVPPVAEIERTAVYTFLIRAPGGQSAITADTAHAPSARAPPAG